MAWDCFVIDLIPSKNEIKKRYLLNFDIVPMELPVSFAWSQLFPNDALLVQCYVVQCYAVQKYLSKRIFFTFNDFSSFEFWIIVLAFQYGGGGGYPGGGYGNNPNYPQDPGENLVPPFFCYFCSALLSLHRQFSSTMGGDWVGSLLSAQQHFSKISEVFSVERCNLTFG